MQNFPHSSSLKSQLHQKISHKRHALEDVFERRAVGNKQGNYLVPSLIYPPAVAADQVPEFLHEKAIEAVEELGALSSWWKIHKGKILNEFLIFSKGPFIDRGSLSSTESTRVSEEIVLLLKALIPFYNKVQEVPLTSSKNPVHILEFLCRRLRVHEFESNELIFSLLMYHEAVVFKQVLSVLKFHRLPEWKFLSYYFSSNIFPTRDHLVSQMMLNGYFLLSKFTCFIRSIIQTGLESDGLYNYLNYRSLISFYSTISFEAISKASHDSKNQHVILSMLTNILKNLKQFRKDNFKDWYLSQLLLLVPLLFGIDLLVTRRTETGQVENMAQFIIRQLITYELQPARPHILSLLGCICRIFVEQSKKSEPSLVIEASTLTLLASWPYLDSLLSSLVNNMDCSALIQTVQFSLASIPKSIFDSTPALTNLSSILPSKSINSL